MVKCVKKSREKKCISDFWINMSGEYGMMHTREKKAKMSGCIQNGRACEH